MKKTALIILGGITFATLFYNQTLGLNALLYSVFLIVVLAIMNFQTFSKPTVIGFSIALLSTAVAIYLHGSTWSIIMHITTMILFIGSIAASTSSIYVTAFNGIYTIIIGMFHSFLYNEPVEKKEHQIKMPWNQIIKLITIPMVLVILFISLYKNTNPIIQQWLNAIDLTFINGWYIFTAIFGSLFMANVITPKPAKEITNDDAEKSNLLALRFISDKEMPAVKQNIQIGTYSIVALNLLLIIILLSEFMFLSNIADYRIATLSQALHRGIYSSIVSIVMAIALIIFCFRGSVNFTTANKNLKLLTYSWIILNGLLLLSVFLKNYFYITNYGLTFKRIGVMVYLILCIVGLITTALKIAHKLNITYLLRRNMTLGYVVLFLFGILNWSAIITSYNIKSNKIELGYLKKLLPQNAIELQRSNMLETVDTYKEYLQYGYSIDEKNPVITPKLSDKFTEPISWQSATYRNYYFKNLKNE